MISETTWSALMAGDFDQVIIAMQYADGANRFIKQIAELASKQYGNERNLWLDTPIIGLDGKTPRQVLVRDDIATWAAVARSLQPRKAIKFEINYTPELPHPS